MSYFICNHCGKKKLANPKLKPGVQKYCSNTACQKTREKKWKKDNYHSNPVYRQKCLRNNKRWRKNSPAHEYQRKYRDTHPEYTEKNKLQQRVRNKPDYVEYRREPGQKIVNGNALLSHAASMGVYAYVPLSREKIVNGNALLIKIRVQQENRTLVQCRNP